MMGRRPGALLVLPLGGILLLAGCSSGSSGGKAASSGSSAGSSAAAGTPVTATETEYSITLSSTSFKPGTYTFTVKNIGKAPHNLTIAGPGISRKASPTEPGGSSGTLTVTLQAGSYELWCSVPGHKDAGMDTKITVS
jgi:plastocyanin